MTHNSECAKLSEIQAEVAKAMEAMDKAANSKLNTVYLWCIRLASIALIASTIYVAFLGFAGSAAVLSFLFLITWSMYLIQQFAVGAVKGVVEHKGNKAAELHHKSLPIPSQKMTRP